MVALTRVALAQITARTDRMSQRIANGEAQIATGERLSRAHEAPADWAELSAIARERATAAAMRSAIGAAQGRAAEAERSIATVTDALTRVSELTIALGGTTGDAGRSAIGTELAALRETVAAAITTRDATGRTVFDGAVAERVAAEGGRLIAATPRESDVATLAGGASIDSIIASAIAASATGSAADRAAALAGVNDAIAHITTEAAKQGVRSTALAQAETALIARDVDRAQRQSALGDTDIAEAITRVTADMTQRDAARAILARTSRETLFDLLR